MSVRRLQQVLSDCLPIKNLSFSLFKPIRRRERKRLKEGVKPSEEALQRYDRMCGTHLWDNIMTAKKTRIAHGINQSKIRLAFRPTPRNTEYLNAMGFIDGRDGSIKTPKDERGLNLSKFVNDCITYLIESGEYRHAKLGPEEIETNILEAKYRSLANENRRVCDEMRVMHERLERARHRLLEKAMLPPVDK